MCRSPASYRHILLPADVRLGHDRAGRGRFRGGLEGAVEKGVTATKRGVRKSPNISPRWD